MARIDKEAAIARIMTGLHCDRAEAEKVFEYDRAVDKDEKTEFDLPKEKMEVARKMTHTGTRKTPPAYKFTKRERKPNATKGGIISELFQFFTENSEFSVENVQILNKERQISFQIGGETYELTLVQKRKPKN